ncbi:MAG: hypothetical protein HKL87_08180 [Acidimicrobiaceae bacterium]|nr:hypothetical protein [Acidimicrobiaceae bacterium]
MRRLWLIVLALLSIGLVAPVASGLSSSSLSAGTHWVSLTWQGRQRSAYVYIPTGSTPHPLVLVYHGATDNAMTGVTRTNLPSLAARGAVVAFLQGYQNSWNDGLNDNPAAQAKVDDVGFTNAMISYLEAHTSINASRVVAVGFSNGALMAEYLGCRLSSRLSAIVPAEGPIPVSVAANCHPARPISVLAIEGTSDTVFPYNGGHFSSVFGGGANVKGAPQTAAFWATMNHCATRPVTTGTGAVRVTRYLRCRNKVTVTLRTNIGGVHVWPPQMAQIVSSVVF